MLSAALAALLGSACLPSLPPPPQSPANDLGPSSPSVQPPPQTPATTSPPDGPVAPALNYCSAAYQQQFGWPDPEKAARVCQCESSGNPRAASPNGKYLGLFQFGASGWQAAGGGDVFDPATNSHHAYRLFLRKGWRPWPHCGRD